MSVDDSVAWGTGSGDGGRCAVCFGGRIGGGGDRVVEKVGLEADSWGVVSGEAQGGQFLSRGCDPEWPSGDQWVRPPLGRPMSWWKPPW